MYFSENKSIPKIERRNSSMKPIKMPSIGNETPSPKKKEDKDVP